MGKLRRKLAIKSRKAKVILKRWRPPAAYSKDLIIGIVGCMLAFVASMDGVAWFALSAYWSAAIHAGLAILVLGCLWRYLRRWERLHSNSIPAGTSAAISELSIFKPLSTAQKVKLISDTIARWHLDPAALRRMADDLLLTEKRRARVIERIQIGGRIAMHEVTVEARDLPTVQLDGRSAFLLLRPLRGASRAYSELVAQNEHGDPLNAMPYVDCAALTYAIIAAAARCSDIEEAGLRQEIKTQLTELVFAESAAQQLVQTLLSLIMQAGGSSIPSQEQDQLTELIQLVSMRRPMYVFTVGQPVNPPHELHLTYSVNLGRSFAKSYTTEWWRERKDTLRYALRYPPKLIRLNLDRSRSAASYQLYVKAPKGLYVDEVGVFNDVSDELRGWVAPLQRESLHGAYIGWERPTGKETTSLGTRNLNSAGLRNAYFCMRFAEIPPGTLGGATIVAFSVLMAAWVAGALAPEENTDIAAFIIAFPGILSSWVGLSPSRSIDRGFRSLSAALSLILSVFISVSSVTLYLWRHAAQQPFVATNFPKGKTVLFVNDYLWLAILVAAFVNLAIVGGTLTMRVKRYRRFLAGR